MFLVGLAFLIFLSFLSAFIYKMSKGVGWVGENNLMFSPRMNAKARESPEGKANTVLQLFELWGKSLFRFPAVKWNSFGTRNDVLLGQASVGNREKETRET